MKSSTSVLPVDNRHQSANIYHSLNGSNNNSGFYRYAHERAEERVSLLKMDSYNEGIGGSYTDLASDDFPSSTATLSPVLHKSNSYTGTITPKTMILKQDSLNGHIATSLTNSDIDFTSSLINGRCCTSPINASIITPAGTPSSSATPAETNDEQDAFLVYSNASNASMGNSNNLTSPRRSPRRNKTRPAICYRVHTFITRNWYLSYLVPLSILVALMLVAYLTRDYAKQMLYWIETQNQWIIFGLFTLFFIIVSFPFIVGYFVLMITAGYLFGCLKGFLTVILGANLGIMIAHTTIRSLRHRIPLHKIIKNETGRAILRVVAGPRAFRVVLFTRLTPIPFGIQNAFFGVSSINPRIYYLATFLGLLPAQAINVYLGSTLRSMHEVLTSHGTATTGYISFVIEVICGIGLMFWVVQKARKELSETFLSDITNDGKILDIQV